MSDWGGKSSGITFYFSSGGGVGSCSTELIENVSVRLTIIHRLGLPVSCACRLCHQPSRDMQVPSLEVAVCMHRTTTMTDGAGLMQARETRDVGVLSDACRSVVVNLRGGAQNFTF